MAARLAADADRAIPAHAWSITEDDGTPDPELAKTPEGARSRSGSTSSRRGEDLSGYSDNPLFDTISGPLALESFSDSGKVTLVKNDAYDGDDAANAETINFLPYTSTDAEVAAVRAGEVDYGYIPTGELANAGQYRGPRIRRRELGGLVDHVHALQLHQPGDGPGL